MFMLREMWLLSLWSARSRGGGAVWLFFVGADPAPCSQERDSRGAALQLLFLLH